MPFYRQSRFEQQKALMDAAIRWLQTPFRKASCALRGGVDCVRLANIVYKESGFDTGFDPKKVKYSLDGGRHRKNSKVIEWIEKSGHFDRVFVKKPEIGDLIVFKIGGVGHHVGVMVNLVNFVHCIKHHGTILSLFDDTTWKSRVEAVYRPMHIEYHATK